MAPNVIFFILDDVGFGQMSAFGGMVNTPNLDRLVPDEKQADQNIGQLVVTAVNNVSSRLKRRKPSR
jgi:hypothetical protein